MNGKLRCGGVAAVFLLLVLVAGAAENDFDGDGKSDIGVYDSWDDTGM